MSKLIDRHKRDQQMLEGGGAGGGAGGGRSGGRSGAGGLSKKEGAVLLGAPAASGLAAVGGSMYVGKAKDAAAARDKAITNTESMQRSAAKARMDESARHYKGYANSTSQK